MRKLAIVAAFATVAAVTPAGAQYFYAGDDGFSVGIGVGPYDGRWYDEPVGYASPYRYAPGYGYASTDDWWGGGYRWNGGYAITGDRWDGGYAYADNRWSGGGPRTYYRTPRVAAYGYAPDYSCRVVRERRTLPNGAVVVRRMRVC